MTGIFYRGFSVTERKRFEGFLERIIANLESD